MELIIYCQVVLFARDVIHCFPGLLARFVPWGWYYPVFGHFCSVCRTHETVNK